MMGQLLPITQPLHVTQPLHMTQQTALIVGSRMAGLHASSAFLQLSVERVTLFT